MTLVTVILFGFHNKCLRVFQSAKENKPFPYFFSIYARTDVNIQFRKYISKCIYIQILKIILKPFGQIRIFQ